MAEIVKHLRKGDVPEELDQVMAAAFQARPDKKALAALRGALAQNPGLWHQVLNISQVIQDRMIGQLSDQPAVALALEANVNELRRGLDYDDSPALEQAMIENIVTSWIRLQYLEAKLAALLPTSHELRQGAYWSQQLSLAQKRFLRASESLARVRKITRQTLVLNIAQPGSQQVNIAGDLVRK